MIGLPTGKSYITNLRAFGREVCDMAVANDYPLVNIIVQLPNAQIVRCTRVHRAVRFSV